MTTWLVRRSGSDSNGGTSKTVRSSGADGTVGADTTSISSISAAWSSADIGHGITASGRTRLITAVQAQQALATVTTTNTSSVVMSSGLFTPAMVGCAISGPGLGINNRVTSYTNANQIGVLNPAGAGFGSGAATIGALITTSGLTVFAGGVAQAWVLGGAFLSTQKSLNGAGATASGTVAGDSVYIGAGIYRETVAVAVSGSAGMPISVYGDVDGAVTGDPGEVQITNYLVDDRHAASATATIAMGTQTFLNFSYLTIVSGAAASPVSNSAGNHDISFQHCVVIAVAGNAPFALTSPATGIACNWTFDSCTVLALGNVAAFGITLATTASGSGDWDANIVVRNSLVMSNNNGLSVASSGTSVNKGGGVRAYGNTFLCNAGGAAVCMGVGGANTSGVIPCEAHGNLMIGGAGTALSATTLGRLVEDRNHIFANVPRSNVAIGPGSISNNSYAPIFDIGQAYKVSGIARPFLSPSSPLSPLVGFGALNVGGPASAFLDERGWNPPGSPGWRPPGLLIPAIAEAIGAQVPLPAVDWANRPRPTGGMSNLPTVGYMEYHDSATKDTVVFDTGPTSAKLVGPGDMDLLVPVDTGSQTLSVRCLYDTTYQGVNLPSLTLLANGEIGVTTQTVAAGGASFGTWQTITLSAIDRKSVV